MAKLSKVRYINRKALATIYSMLAGAENPPSICEYGSKYWITNGYVAFAFNKEDFIFNPNVFKPFNIIPALEKAKRISTVHAVSDSYKTIRNDLTLVKLVSADKTPVFVNKSYLDMFAKECTFRVSNPLEPVVVVSPYDEVCGIILPVRHEKDSW